MKRALSHHLQAYFILILEWAFNSQTAETWKGTPRVSSSRELKSRDDDPIGVRVQPLAVVNHCPADVHGHMLIADAPLVGLHRVRSQGANTNVAGVDLVDIPYAAVHQNSGPSHVLSELAEVASHQGATGAPPAVDDENPAVAGALEHVPNQEIVLKHFERDDGARESYALPVRSEDRVEDSDFAVCEEGLVGVAHLGCC
ncbi:hypothetical protein HPP92_000384 [Vanilla planifolia]|uniref:Uncharacterized protein n=1 Tax=Vanilla planifolia TaxID=51239 RepID=A0A835SB35_VANPL|nr:hypothetical protein HPP92_000384 [Vanilla planifolia]